MYPNNLYKYIFLPASLCTLLYVIIRAVCLNITYDEANTIIDLVPNSVIHILNGTPSVANNHILNTLLIKLFYLTGIKTLFMARLPNVLAFLLYLCFSYKILIHFIPGRIGAITFLLLLLNPFLLDFFGLARGYGISLGFQMASLYYVLLFLRSASSSRYLAPAMLYGMLSVLANLSTLNFFLGIAGTLGLYILFNLKENRLNNPGLLLLATVVLTLIIWEPVRKLKAGGSLWYGGNTGFYEDTLLSLANYTFYSADSSSLVKVSLNCFLVLLGITFLSTSKFRAFFSDLKNSLFLLLVFIVLSVILQHYLIGNLFIIDRSALFLYPLAIVLLGFSFQDLKEKRLSFSLSLITVLFFGVNFFSHANFYKTATWFFDGHTTDILKRINEEGRQSNTKMKVDYSWPFFYSTFYHTQNNRFPFIELVNEAPPEVRSRFDYYIHLGKYIDKTGYDPLGEPIVKADKDTVLSFKEEGVYVFKRK